MSPSTPPRSSRKLSEVARHLVVPDGAVSTAWPSVARQIKRMGMPLDMWQQNFTQLLLSKRADGIYACGVGGAIASWPRQTGKTHTLGAVTFGLALAEADTLIVWTAHRARTHAETFKSMTALAENPKIKPLIKRVFRQTGAEAVEFGNGSRILFGARENGFGRGFAKVDLLVFDEAQILTEKAMEDMVPATNAAPNGLVLMVGTPPRPTDPGEVFSARRDDALSGADEETLYVEMSADPKARLDDTSQWAIANPSFPHRVSKTSFQRMRKLLGSDDSFRREALGIWDEKTIGRKAFKFSSWAALKGSPETSEGVKVFGVKFSSDGSHVALSAALKTGPDSPIHVEAIRSSPMSEGTQWLVDFFTDRADTVGQVVIDGRAGVGYLVEALRRNRIPAKMIVTPTLDQVVTAHTMLEQGITQATLTHSAQPHLDDQVRDAKRRPIGKSGAFGWEPSHEDGSVALLDAVTLAYWGAKTTKRKPGRTQRFR